MQPLKIILPAVFIFLSSAAISQNFAKQFKEIPQKDTAAQGKLLQSWEKSNAKDPELFIAYFNYYVRKSLKEIVSLDADRKNDQSFQMTDSSGKVVGYMNSIMKYDPRMLQKGFDYIDRGIALYPSRLDMRFGKVYMFGEAESYAFFTNTIIETIDYGEKIKQAWLWKEGKPLDDPKEFFLSSVQDYITTLYNTQEDSLLPYMRRISEQVLKYYPNHVESLSNVAVTYLIISEYDKALPYLLKAEKINPKDAIVLNNIAEAYKGKKDKANAKAYYEKVIKYGDEELVQEAKEKMKNL